MKLATNHYQLASHNQKTACLCPSTLLPPDLQCAIVLAVLNLCLESVPQESVRPYQSRLLSTAPRTFL